MRGYTSLRGSSIGANSASPSASSSVYSGSKKREPFYKTNAIGLPAFPSAFTVITSFLIPPGRNAILWKVGVDYVGSGFTEGSGDLIYALFRNAALTRAVKGFNNLTASMGSVNNPLEITGTQFYENEQISICVKNVSVAAGGAQLVGVLHGWTYPRADEEQQRWP